MDIVVARDLLDRFAHNLAIGPPDR
jgi:hypothetical protein